MAIELDADGDGIAGAIPDARADSTIDAGIASGSSGALDPAASVGSDAPKRGRGRPRKDGGPGNGSGQKPSGSAAPAKAKPTPLDVDGFALQLVGVHLMAAALFKAPELAIGEKEAKQLAQALKNIAAQYSVTISPKAMAFTQLLAAGAMIYGPRFAAIGMRRKKEAHAKREAMDRNKQVVVQSGIHNPLEHEHPAP
jgi:hypothetical protein